MAYDVKAELYEGPLPLLVELTKLNLIDVFILQLVGLTKDYLARVKEAGGDLNRLAEPLPLLGTLIALKARGLLPQAVPAEDEEVPISLEELERRLKDYEQFKTVAQLLAELHTLQHQHFTREPAGPPPDDDIPASELPFDVGIQDLMTAFAKVLERATAPVYEVAAEPWTVEGKAKELRVLLTVRREVRFLELFNPQQSKLELVVTFLALLELMRQRAARAVQERQFGEILITVYERRTRPREAAARPGAADGARTGQADR
jgi:segregation and condensation protein A